MKLFFWLVFCVWPVITFKCLFAYVIEFRWERERNRKIEKERGKERRNRIERIEGKKRETERSRKCALHSVIIIQSV